MLVAQSCPALCDPQGYSLAGSSVRGISQARILEWIVIFFSRESSQTRDGTRVSCVAGRLFTIWATFTPKYLAFSKKQPKWRWWNSSWAISNPKRWRCETAALYMSANLENSAMSTGLEKVSFHSSPKERLGQTMFKLPHNCTHFTH